MADFVEVKEFHWARFLAIVFIILLIFAFGFLIFLFGNDFGFWVGLAIIIFGGYATGFTIAEFQYDIVSLSRVKRLPVIKDRGGKK